MITQEQYDELLNQRNALRAKLAQAEQDGKRYQARRNYDWCEYDDFCNSCMPRDGSATRQNQDQFNKQYDEDSDSMLEDYDAPDAGREGR